MIKILVNKKSNQLSYIKISGHANYSNDGSDIVCAAVSSIAQTSINACLMFNNSCFNYKVNDGLIIIENISNDEITLKLLSNMLLMLEQVANDYPKNVNIRNEG